ncbi:RAD protein (Pv-fam-e) [Plasmodium ovale curtisi]|uniref:RAD protein (Pv-fam-e) n=1 Tax=Plasmodium ovale curtisi TaxID=864141 RepID=A0A1A8X6L5_PLAOA|nr:RAD protein (Pv-fam-e) [Plasmodium ovale curtisi]SBT00890.1 RAD protein (Pv-fam-e) [Plasmodium ovale curtisi]
MGGRTIAKVQNRENDNVFYTNYTCRASSKEKKNSCCDCKKSVSLTQQGSAQANAEKSSAYLGMKVNIISKIIFSVSNWSLKKDVENCQHKKDPYQGGYQEEVPHESVQAVKLCLLYVILCISKGHAPSSMTNMRNSRALSELSLYLRDYPTENSMYGSQSSLYNNKSNNEMLQGYMKPYSTKQLTREEVNQLIESCNFIVGKKKANIVFYHYNRYLHKLYNEMVNRLWANFEHLSSLNKIPYGIKMKYWEECDEDLSQNFIQLEKYSQMNFNSFMKQKKNVYVLAFHKFLGYHKISWKRSINRIERKWAKYLTDTVVQYAQREHF